MKPNSGASLVRRRRGPPWCAVGGQIGVRPAVRQIGVLVPGAQEELMNKLWTTRLMSRSSLREGRLKRTWTSAREITVVVPAQEESSLSLCWSRRRRSP